MRRGAPADVSTSHRGALAALRSTAVGRFDPTTRCDASGYWRAALTPHGPATVHATVADGGVDVRGAWGPGGQWLAERMPRFAGSADCAAPLTAHHGAVEGAVHRHRQLRIGRTDDLYHALLPTVLAQRITAGEAIRQWSTLVHRLGSPAPGPRRDLWLPPEPARLAGQPSWSMHRWGIEGRRADTLRAVARVAERLWAWTEPGTAAAKLALIPGVGRWTVGTVLGAALGDPDAVAVGDFHLKNVVSSALAGRPRGTDEEMLELLEPYRGQRGRVVRLLLADGWQAAKFGSRQRILPMSQW